MKRLVVRLAVAMLIPTAASAAGSGVHFLAKDDRLFCESDRLALCSGLNRQDAEACLIQSADQISDSDCKKAVNVAKSQVKDFMQACQIDIDLHCSGLDYGKDLLACLQKHKRSLLGTCQDQL